MTDTKSLTRTTNKQIFLAWIKFQRRPSNMQSWFGFELIFIPSRIRLKILKPLDYLSNGFKTLRVLFRERPNVIWIQLPPTPLLTLALLYKQLNKKTILIVDCHNGLFATRWRKFLGDMTSLNQADIIITHNSVIGDIAAKEGVLRDKMMVLETKPVDKTIGAATPVPMPGHILMPCAFAYDEPLSVVFEAATLAPEITFLISGDSRKNAGNHDLTNLPKNVKLTGYLSNSEYEQLFRAVDAVLGLTTETHVQLSVANEATGFEKPMVLSDTPLLRELFHRGAIYVDTLDANSIANGVKATIVNKSELGKEVQILKKQRNERWEKQASNLKERIESLQN
jgi:glycosyltransferase involved in cell wall biosynthesis